MKVLTICSAGACRSVAMAHVLKQEFGHDAVPVGRDKNSKETIDLLSKWADRIILMQPDYGVGLLKEYWMKVVPPGLTDVGPDVWVNPLSPRLQEKVFYIAQALHQKGYLERV